MRPRSCLPVGKSKVPDHDGMSRVVDPDAGTVAMLRVYRSARGLLALDLVRDSALVLSNLDGTYQYPERCSRRFAAQVVQARKALVEDLLPVVRLHDLRRSHALAPEDDPVGVGDHHQERGGVGDADQHLAELVDDEGQR